MLVANSRRWAVIEEGNGVLRPKDRGTDFAGGSIKPVRRPRMRHEGYGNKVKYDDAGWNLQLFASLTLA